MSVLLRDESSLGEAREDASRDDNVIMDRYSNDLARFDQLFGDGEILLARFRVSTRMIVYEDNTGRVFNNRLAKYFTRMRKRGVQKSPGDGDLPRDSIGAVQVDNEKDFLIQIAQFGYELLSYVRRRPNDLVLPLR